MWMQRVHITIKQEAAVRFIMEMSTTVHTKDDTLEETRRTCQWNDTNGLHLIDKNACLSHIKLTIGHESQSNFQQPFL
jgi:hypothetical protein